MQSIPHELYRQVVEGLDNLNDSKVLYALLFVNRVFNYEAQHIIYRTIYAVEAGEQLLQQLCQSSKMADLVEGLYITVDSTSSDRMDMVRNALRHLTNLTRLTVDGDQAFELADLFNLTNELESGAEREGQSSPFPFRLHTFRTTNWNSLIRPILRPHNKLQALEIRLSDENQLPVVGSILRECTSLLELKLRVHRNIATIRLPQLLEGCKFQLRLLSCHASKPKVDLVDLIIRYPLLERVTITTRRTYWPQLAAVIRDLTHLTRLRIYSGHRLDISHLLDAKFQLKTMRLGSFHADPNMSTFLSQQPQIMTLYPPREMEHPFSLPKMTTVYGETALLVKIFRLSDVSSVTYLYWMKDSVPGGLGGNPEEADLEIILKWCPPLRSLAVPPDVSLETLSKIVAAAPQLRYLHMSVADCTVHDLNNLISQLPSLTVLRLIKTPKPVVEDEPSLHQSYAPMLLDLHPTLKRVHVLEESEASTAWTISYTRNTPLGVWTPEPDWPKEGLMPEFRDVRYGNSDV